MDKKIDPKWLLGVTGGAHVKDSLLVGITYEDLITAVFHNEPVVNEATVRRTLSDMVKQHMKDMNGLLDANMSKIIKLVTENR